MVRAAIPSGKAEREDEYFRSVGAAVLSWGDRGRLIYIKISNEHFLATMLGGRCDLHRRCRRGGIRAVCNLTGGVVVR